MSVIQFSPSKKLLDSIEIMLDHPLMFVVPTLNAHNDDQQLEKTVLYIEIFKFLLQKKYKDRFTPEHSQYILVNLFSEPFRNAMSWGNKLDPTKDLVIALWFGEKGILVGFRDEGDHFSRKETKRIYENRLPVTTSRVSGIGGAGTKRLYSKAHEILVATEENTLYATYLIPELSS